MSQFHMDTRPGIDLSPVLDLSSPPTARASTGERLLAVFDLDGTLVDTAPDLSAALDHCLDLAGMPALPLEAVRPYAGLGARAMIEHAYAHAGRALSADELARQTQCFLAYYEANIAVRSAPYPGAIAALDRLDAAGIALAVCTNKFEHLSRRLLGELDLVSRFEAICGADTFPRRKPDPIHLLGTIARAGGSVQRAVMIGDTRTDIDAALAAGVPSILVDFGYAPDESARRGADRIISSFDELDHALVRSLTEGELEAAG